MTDLQALATKVNGLSLVDRLHLSAQLLQLGKIELACSLVEQVAADLALLKLGGTGRNGERP